ncbi:MAG: hypothetical protein WCL59_10080 [Cyanobium sp. ELA507]
MIAALAPPLICVVKSFYSFLAPLPKLALGAAVTLGALSLSPGSAQAACAPGTPSDICRVTVGGLQYDVTTFTGRYDQNTSKFATQANGGQMPWFGSPGNADLFAAAVETSLGTPNFGSGPYFSYAIGLTGLPSDWPSARYYNTSSSSIEDFNTAAYNQHTWATVTFSTAPAPGPMPLFGAGAAFGFSRKLRKRIQGSLVVARSSQPPA